MKHFHCILSLALFAAGSAQAAPARTFNSTQIFNSRGASGSTANWFYEVQPLPAAVQPLKSPATKKQPNPEEQPKPTAVGKEVKAIPLLRTPRHKTVRDTRKVEVTASANDTQKVSVKTKLAPQAGTKTNAPKPPYQKSLLDETEFDPNHRNKSLTSDNGVLQRTPAPKPRRHGFRDWP